MTKAEMLIMMIDDGYYAPVVSEYKHEGYTEDGAIRKTVEYYAKHMTKAEIKEVFDDYMWTHYTW